MKKPFFLGEGPMDVGDAGVHRRVPCDYEGDLPRLVRRLVHRLGGPDRFGYEATTLREVVSTIPRTGTPMRRGGKAKELRDAVLASVQPGRFVIAVIDARTEELNDLAHDAEAILAECLKRDANAHVAIGFAVQEIEIWMMADPNSRVAAFGEKVAAFALPSDLEGHGDPKALWSERAGQADKPVDLDPSLFADAQRARAWDALRPEVVRETCPLGFDPFVTALSKYVATRSG